jgi:hypothetical protein
MPQLLQHGHYLLSNTQAKQRHTCSSLGQLGKRGYGLSEVALKGEGQSDQILMRQCKVRCTHRFHWNWVVRHYLQQSPLQNVHVLLQSTTRDVTLL